MPSLHHGLVLASVRLRATAADRQGCIHSSSRLLLLFQDLARRVDLERAPQKMHTQLLPNALVGA